MTTTAEIEQAAVQLMLTAEIQGALLRLIQREAKKAGALDAVTSDLMNAAVHHGASKADVDAIVYGVA